MADQKSAHEFCKLHISEHPDTNASTRFFFVRHEPFFEATFRDANAAAIFFGEPFSRAAIRDCVQPPMGPWVAVSDVCGPGPQRACGSSGAHPRAPAGLARRGVCRVASAPELAEPILPPGVPRPSPLRLARCEIGRPERLSR